MLNEFVPERIEVKGADGLFLDTIDTVEAYPESWRGMIKLIAALRKKYPRIPIVANRGFTILEGMIPEIDGILFEAFTTRWDPGRKSSSLHSDSDLEWVDGVLAKIQKLGGSLGIQVLVLDYAGPGQDEVARRARKRADVAGLTWSLTTGSLDALPFDGGPGSPSSE